MASLGLPLLGDSKYGDFAANREHGAKSQYLCAYKLKFAFTTDAGILNYLSGREFTIEVPFSLPDM
jgi:23S rRNA pseudouridine955/2504/2580 synthase